MALVVARHEYQKGIDLAVRAMAGVLAASPDARLLIAGREGNATDALEQLVRTERLTGAVTFLGARDDVADLIAAADALVVPSRWEGFPGTVLEGMAIGCPIVAVRVPGMDEALGAEQSALVVAPEDSRALAEAVRAVFADPAAAATRSALAQRRFGAHFSIEPVADRMAAFYEHAVL